MVNLLDPILNGIYGGGLVEFGGFGTLAARQNVPTVDIDIPDIPPSQRHHLLGVGGFGGSGPFGSSGLLTRRTGYGAAPPSESGGDPISSLWGSIFGEDPFLRGIFAALGSVGLPVGGNSESEGNGTGSGGGGGTVGGGYGPDTGSGVTRTESRNAKKPKGKKKEGGSGKRHVKKEVSVSKEDGVSALLAQMREGQRASRRQAVVDELRSKTKAWEDVGKNYQAAVRTAKGDGSVIELRSPQPIGLADSSLVTEYPALFADENQLVWLENIVQKNGGFVLWDPPTDHLLWVQEGVVRKAIPQSPEGWSFTTLGTLEEPNLIIHSAVVRAMLRKRQVLASDIRKLRKKLEKMEAPKRTQGVPGS